MVVQKKKKRKEKKRKQGKLDPGGSPVEVVPAYKAPFATGIHRISPPNHGQLPEDSVGKHHAFLVLFNAQSPHALANDDVALFHLFRIRVCAAVGGRRNKTRKASQAGASRRLPFVCAFPWRGCKRIASCRMSPFTYLKIVILIPMDANEASSAFSNGTKM